MRCSSASIRIRRWRTSFKATGPREDAAMTQRPTNIHPAYHAHIYFGPDTVGQARALAEQASQTFGVSMGRVHEKRVGPHPSWSCQLAFDAKDFDKIVPWLDTHRGDLDVFVHGLTGNDLDDHTKYA